MSGRKPGEGMGMLRDIIIADSDEEARQLWVDSATFAGNAWFVPFGFRRGMLDPKTGEAPSTEEAIAKGYALVGTVDTVTRSLEALKKKLPVNWIFGWTHNTLVPHGLADALDRALLHRGTAARELTPAQSYCDFGATSSGAGGISICSAG